MQARQTYVYARAASAGFEGPWLQVARRGFQFLVAHGRRPDGLFAEVLNPAGGVLDGAAKLYEQAFVLLALSALHGAEPSEPRHHQEAVGLRERLNGFRFGPGGFRERGAQPYQANAQMHLLEAALAWEALGGDADWGRLADEVVQLALRRFIDPESGVLNEYFDAHWRPLTGSAGLVEPGHQFEWAWLLERWGVLRGDAGARQAARRLLEAGRGGVDPVRGVLVDSVWPDMTVRAPTARLWPQAERLRAALLFCDESEALAAVHTLTRYLDTPVRGAWRDVLAADGEFIAGPAPASSLYHLLGAVLALLEVAAAPKP